jgi:hypothetical protein
MNEQERHFCAACGKRRYEKKMVKHSIPENGIDFSWYCKGRFYTSNCQSEAIKMLYRRRKYLIALLDSVTKELKESNQMEII